MMILYGKEGLRNTLLYQNHARNSNLGSNLFITYIWLVKSLILSLKITIFWTNSTLAHHFNMMLRFATKVFAKSNYHKIMGYQMRYVWTCYTDLYIYFLNQTWNIWSKKLHFARVFWLFGLPNFIHWPCNAQIRIPHEILHWDSAPHVTLALKEMSLEHGKEILAELRYSMFLGWQFVDPAH